MSLEKLLESYLNTLYGYFKYDLSVFENPWMYIPMFIPIIFYLVFFILKWSILTAPFWIPIKMSLKGFSFIYDKGKKMRP